MVKATSSGGMASVKRATRRVILTVLWPAAALAPDSRAFVDGPNLSPGW
jgi:hypothetical protein